MLTNPPDLRAMNEGLTGEIRATRGSLAIRASITAEQNYGATNPGDAFFENDPGMIGTLFLDPNMSILSAGQTFMDRAFAGKFTGAYRVPHKFGGMELSVITDYFDGSVFARYLLVTGLPQGPFLVPATYGTTQPGVSPVGSRSQGVVNWNVCLGRSFSVPAGTLHASLDVLNLLNGSARVEENDLSGTDFIYRLPLAVQTPRFARLELRYQF